MRRANLAHRDISFLLTRTEEPSKDICCPVQHVIDDTKTERIADLAAGLGILHIPRRPYHLLAPGEFDEVTHLQWLSHGTGL